MAFFNHSSNISLPSPNFIKETMFCKEERSNILLQGGIYYTFISLYASFGIFGLLLNGFVIQIIKATKQSQNQSIKLLMYLSCVDLVSSIIALGRIPLFVNGEKTSCRTLSWTYFLSLLSIYASNYLFALTGFDRFLRIKYLEDYNQYFTCRRFRVIMAWYVFLTILQSGIGAYFNSKHHIGYASSYVMPINIIVVIITILFYALSIYKLRQLRKTNQAISDATKSVLKVTKIYLYLFVCSTGATLIYQVVLNRLTLSRLQPLIMQNVIILLPTILGCINAVAFLVLNPHAKRYIVTLQSELFRGSAVDHQNIPI